MTPHPVPIPMHQLGARDAVNLLMAQPWADFVPPLVAARSTELGNSLDGAKLAEASGSADPDIKWDFSLHLKDVKAAIDLTNPPGFSEIRPVVADGGFTLDAPLKDSWNIGFNGKLDLTSKADGAGIRLWTYTTPPIAWGLALSKLKIQAVVRTDGTHPNWPTLRSLAIRPTVQLKATGAIPFELGPEFQVTVKPGLLQFKARLTHLSVGLGNELDAQLDVNFMIEIRPNDTYNVHNPFGGSIEIPTVKVKIVLDGELKFNLPHVPSRLSAGLSLPLEATLPVPEILSTYLQLATQTWPVQIGKGNPKGAVQAAPPGFDFAKPAQEIEAATRASHIPYNALFTIEHQRSVKLRMWSARYHYSDEEDSSIWTGHFLAAAAFRYAATKDPDALQLVQQLLAGVDQLFEVCTDAVVKNGVRSAVRDRGFFARSVLPDDSVGRWWEADDNIAIHNRAFYEKPEGGWEAILPDGTNQHFGSYALVEARFRELAGQGALIRPVGRVWCGIGAGGTLLDAATDHQLSRDQIIGMCFGLFSAWSLVEDSGVKNGAAKRLSNLIDYIALQHNWNVPLPPDTKAVCTSYLGAFDHQLTLLRIGATVDPAKFSAAYEKVKAASACTWVSLWTTVLDPLSMYYKFNLSHAAMVPLLLAETDAQLRQDYFTAYNILREATSHHRNAWFNLASILVQLPQDRAIYMATTMAGSNPSMHLPEEIKGILVEWLERRDRVKETNGLPTNDVPDPQSIVDLWNDQPDQIQKYTASDGSSSYIAKFALPVDQRVGGIMEFTWQNDPFRLGVPGTKAPGKLTLQEAKVTAEPRRECTGVDYLLTYWIAVYLGILPKPA